MKDLILYDFVIGEITIGNTKDIIDGFCQGGTEV